MKSTVFYDDDKLNNLDINDLMMLYDEVKDEEKDSYKVQPVKQDENELNYKKNDPDKICLYGGGSGGGLLTTLSDFMKYTSMLLHKGFCVENGNEIISSRVIDYMNRNHLPDNKTIKEVIHDRSYFKNVMAKGKGTGLGMVNMTDNSLSNGIGSLQSVGSFYAGGAGGTYYWVDPKEELCVVFCTQIFAAKLDYKHDLERIVYSSIVD